MSDKAIEPSEILYDKSGSIKEDLYHANPWIRLLARFADYAWFFLAIWILKFFIHKKIAPSKFESFIPLEFFAWIPIESAFLSIWGTTPAKYFLKIKLRQGRRFKLPFRLAIKRSFNVWLRGLGMMIPIVNGLCMIVSYYRLKTFQTTTWDQEDHIVVSQEPLAQWRIVSSAIFTVLSLFFYFKN